MKPAIQFERLLLSLTLTLSAALITHTATADADVANVVDTTAGEVSGTLAEHDGATLRIFKGIPYAAPPVGELRWKRPQPPVPWEGVRDATDWSDRCPQAASSMMGAGGIGISEDCLYLNLVTPARSTADQLPVMVFFHGGGLTSGTGNSPLYNHTALPSKGVVVVTVNSRLGPIGYMAHPALTAESGHNASGNYGTLDLIASLEWVQANITSFGGDPDNVLIFGESGGGTKTLSLLTSPLAEGLFHKAVVESGSASASPERTTTLETAEAGGEKIAAKLGLEGNDVLAGLRAASWEDVIAAASDPELGYRANLTVDGWVAPLSVNETLKQGKQHDVPLIVGANEGEQRELEQSVPRLANLMSATASSGTYVYNFSHVPTGWRDLGCVAFHGLELPYVFGYVPEGLTGAVILFLGDRSGCKSREPGADELDRLVAEHAMTLWTQFAKTGDPSVDGLVDWPAYTEEDDRYLEIGASLEVREGIRSAYRAPTTQ